MADLDSYGFEDWAGEDPAAEEEPYGAEEAYCGRSVPGYGRDRGRHVQAEPVWEESDRQSAGAWETWRKALIPAAALLLVAVVILGVGYAYARRVAQLTTIYPNVTVNGVAVGGMTVDEAAAALGDDPARYDNAAVTVNFPTGDSVTVTAQDLGLQPLDGTDFARAAYGYGRGGSMLANMKDYLYCRKNTLNMQVDPAETGGVDENTIAALIGPAAGAVDEKLSKVDARVGQDAITLVKNTGTARVDVAALSRQIREAFEREEYAPIDYQVPDSGEPQPGAVDIDAVLQTLYNEIYAAPANAVYDPVTGGVIPGTQGVRFDVDAARAVWDQAASGQTVTIPILREDPEITAEQLSGQLFQDVLAEKSTSLAGSTSARINNITLAAAAMNGVVLQPGQEFNYNQCLGQRTAEKGYQSAGAFSGGQHVMSIGGGICQGSSTLYYCALKANLTITDRWCHQFLVSYLPRGMDATVSWGWPDFKFVNSRNYPIRIEAYVSGGYLTIRLLGTDEDGSYVEITNETWEDAAHYYAQTYRNVYDRNGALISSQKEAYSAYDKEEALAAAAATATPAPQVPEVQAPQQIPQEQVPQEPAPEIQAPQEPAPEMDAPPPAVALEETVTEPEPAMPVGEITE